MTINLVNIPFPDFQNGAIMLESQFDANNASLVLKVNEIIPQTNTNTDEIALRAISADTYNKTEVDAFVNAIDVRNQADEDVMVAHKISNDHDGVYYTKTQVDGNIYTKVYIDTNIYTKAEVDLIASQIQAGLIIDNSLTESKMADEMKKIAGGVYPYDEGVINRDSINANNKSAKAFTFFMT